VPAVRIRDRERERARHYADRPRDGGERFRLVELGGAIGRSGAEYQSAGSVQRRHAGRAGHRRALYETRGGVGLKTQVTVSWTPASDAQVERYQVRYKLAADADSDGSYFVLAPTENYWQDLFDVAAERLRFPGPRHQCARRALGWINDAQGDPRPRRAPEDVTGLSIQAAGGFAYLRWDLHPALDVREGGGIVFRHSSQTDDRSRLGGELRHRRARRRQSDADARSRSSRGPISQRRRLDREPLGQSREDLDQAGLRV
jgi:hypothetical protein